MAREHGPTSRSRLARILAGLAAAALGAAVFATHVYVDFPRVRERIVRTPVAVQTRTSVAVPDLAALAGQPAALVVEVENPGATPLSVVIAFDDREVATRVLQPGERRRLDTSVLFAPGPHVATFTGDRSGWTLRGLEVANVHGFSRDPLELVVVPRARRAPAPSPVLVFVVFAVVLALALWPLPPPRRGVWLLRAAAALPAAVLMVSLTADRVSPFAILIARRTFVLLIVLLYLRKVATAASLVVRTAWPPVIAATLFVWRLEVVRRTRRAIVSFLRDVVPVMPHLVIVGAMLQGVAGFWTPSVGFTPLILFGSEFAERAVPALQGIPHAVEQRASGYDGQFYAQLALDPLLRDPDTLAAMDNPAYRARRMFFPLVAWAAGLGQPAWIIQAYAVLNVIAWVALAIVLFAWFPPGGRAWARAFGAWTGCLLANGWIMSIRLALTDGPSLLLMAVSVLLVERARLGAGAGVLSLAILGRETSALGAVTFLPRALRGIAFGRVVAVMAAAVPFGLWIVYLRSLGLTDVGVPGNLGPPLAGLWDKSVVTIAELTDKGWWGSWARLSLVCLIGMAVQAAYIVWRWRWHSAWWRIGFVHAVMMLFLGPAVLEGYPSAMTRAMLPLALAFNVELRAAGRSFWPLWILGNLSVLTSTQEFIHVPFIGPLI